MPSRWETFDYLNKRLASLSDLKGDFKNNGVALDKEVTVINCLIMPFAWVGIDGYGELHVTYVGNEIAQPIGGAPSAPDFKCIAASKFAEYADHLWRFMPADRKLTCMKSRTYHAGTVIQCHLDTVR